MERESSGDPTRLRYLVRGMDCAACEAKSTAARRGQGHQGIVDVWHTDCLSRTRRPKKSGFLRTNAPPSRMRAADH